VARVVLDASVLIAFLDAGDRHHKEAIAALERTRSDDRILPASAYAEVLVVPNRAGPEAVARADRILSELPVRVASLDPECARTAAALRARHRALKLGDALVLATAEVLDAAVLTADRAWPKISSRARLI